MAIPPISKPADGRFNPLSMYFLPPARSTSILEGEKFNPMPSYWPQPETPAPPVAKTPIPATVSAPAALVSGGMPPPGSVRPWASAPASSSAPAPAPAPPRAPAAVKPPPPVTTKKDVEKVGKQITDMARVGNDRYSAQMANIQRGIKALANSDIDPRAIVWLMQNYVRPIYLDPLVNARAAAQEEALAMRKRQWDEEAAIRQLQREEDAAIRRGDREEAAAIREAKRDLKNKEKLARLRAELKLTSGAGGAAALKMKDYIIGVPWVDERMGVLGTVPVDTRTGKGLFVESGLESSVPGEGRLPPTLSYISFGGEWGG